MRSSLLNTATPDKVDHTLYRFKRSLQLKCQGPLTCYFAEKAQLIKASHMEFTISLELVTYPALEEDQSSSIIIALQLAISRAYYCLFA